MSSNIKHSCPFDEDEKQPNQKTIVAMLEAEHITKTPSIKKYSNVEEALRILKE